MPCSRPFGLTSKRASPAGQAFESTSRISGQRNIGISRQARVGVRMPLLKNISSDTHRVGNQQGDNPRQTLPLPNLSSSHPGHQVSSCRVKQFSPPRHSPEICAERQCFHRAPVVTVIPNRYTESDPPVKVYSFHHRTIKFTLSSLVAGPSRHPM